MWMFNITNSPLLPFCLYFMQNHPAFLLFHFSSAHPYFTSVPKLDSHHLCHTYLFTHFSFIIASISYNPSIHHSSTAASPPILSIYPSIHSLIQLGDDLERNDGSAEKPFLMSPELHRILGKSSQVHWYPVIQPTPSAIIAVIFFFSWIPSEVAPQHTNAETNWNDGLSFWHRANVDLTGSLELRQEAPWISQWRHERATSLCEKTLLWTFNYTM